MPIFQQGGWFDPYSGSHLRSFAAIGDRVPNRVLMGPVVARGGGRDLPRRRRPLRRRDRDPRPRARLLRPLPPGRGERLGGARRRSSSSSSARNEWRGESEWPLAGTEFTPFYLRAGGELDRDAAARATSRPTATSTTPTIPVPTIGGVNSVLTMTQGAAEPILPGPWDQRALEARDDVLVVHERRARPRPRGDRPGRDGAVTRRRARSDTDFIVRVCDVYPDGRSIFLTEGIIRARYRNSNEGD